MLNPDNTPAEHVGLVVEPGNAQVRSGASGFAKLPVNTEENASKLTITVSTSLGLLSGFPSIDEGCVCVTRVPVIPGQDQGYYSSGSQTSSSQAGGASVRQHQQKLHPLR